MGDIADAANSVDRFDRTLAPAKASSRDSVAKLCPIILMG